MFLEVCWSGGGGHGDHWCNASGTVTFHLGVCLQTADRAVCRRVCLPVLLLHSSLAFLLVPSGVWAGKVDPYHSRSPCYSFAFISRECVERTSCWDGDIVSPEGVFSRMPLHRLPGCSFLSLSHCSSSLTPWTSLPHELADDQVRVPESAEWLSFLGPWAWTAS